MTSPEPETCAACRSVLSTRGSKYERARMLSGLSYCTSCISKLQFTCEGCRKPMQINDFEQGRAMTLLGGKYCENCLEGAIHQKAKPAPAAAEVPPAAAPDPSAGDEWDAHRSHARFIPPIDCRLSVKRAGFRGLLSGNALRLWVDVSEGGLRVILGGSYAVDDVLQGTIVYPPRQASYTFRGTVRYAKASERFRRSMVVGIRFDAASRGLQAFIRDVMGDRPSLAPAPRRNPASQFPPPRTKPATQVPAPRHG